MKLIGYVLFFSKNCWKICLLRGSCDWSSDEADTVYVCAFLSCRCVAIYPTPRTCLAIATKEVGGTETNTSLPIFHTRDKWDETVCFNPLVIPNAIKFSTPIAITVVNQIPAFPLTSASQIPGWVSSPSWGWGAQVNTSVWPQSTFES